MASLNAHLRDLHQELRETYEIHAQEVVEVRLRGKRAADARVPVRLFTRLSDHFMRAILTAATRIKTGRDFRRVPKDVEQTLNLSFAEMKPGSTRLFFTIDSYPDLFGESLGENTLSTTFSILAKQSLEELIDDIDAIGMKSLKNIHDMFADVLQEKLEMDIRWSDINAREYQWQGKKKDLEQWTKRIERIRSQDLPAVTLRGIVSLISLSGRLELYLDDGTKIRSVFPMNLLESVRHVTINDKVSGVFARRQVVDLSKGIERINFVLQSIALSND